MFFQRIGNGIRIMKTTLGFVFRKPIFLVPIFFALVTSFAVNLAIVLSLANTNLTNQEYLGISLLMIFVSSFFISLGQLIILELLEQHETSGDMRLFKAIGDALTRDLIRALPIIIFWSLIQFIIKILDSMMSGNSDRGRSFIQAILSRLLRALQRGLQWGVMLILTAIAWEDVRPGEAYRKAKTVYKDYFVEMLTGISISGLISFLFIIPVVIVMLMVQYGVILFSLGLLIGIFVWFVLTYCMGVVIEQIYAAELYMWYRVFEDEVETAERSGKEAPVSIEQVPRPTFFDNVPDLLFQSRNKKDTQVDFH